MFQPRESKEVNRMPTPTGLPKRGERWKFTQALPPDWIPESVVVTVLNRTGGEYWALYVLPDDGKARLWVDASYFWATGKLTYEGGE
jgi:hypothetical protein